MHLSYVKLRSQNLQTILEALHCTRSGNDSQPDVVKIVANLQGVGDVFA
jgi:hypothetical protein